ncbi:hypothetical protein ACHAWC_009998 [Mediolabrus comicus]
MEERRISWKERKKVDKVAMSEDSRKMTDQAEWSNVSRPLLYNGKGKNETSTIHTTQFTHATVRKRNEGGQRTNHQQPHYDSVGSPSKLSMKVSAGGPSKLSMKPPREIDLESGTKGPSKLSVKLSRENFMSATDEGPSKLSVKPHRDNHELVGSPSKLSVKAFAGGPSKLSMKPPREIGLESGTDGGLSKQSVKPSRESLVPPADVGPSKLSVKPAAGLAPPELATQQGVPVTGAKTQQLRRQNKQQRKVRLGNQDEPQSYWKNHQGFFSIPTPKQAPQAHVNNMCPSGLALEHPAAEVLLEYASGGCPTLTGNNWSREMIEAAIARGTHKSARSPEAIAYFQSEIEQKLAAGQVKVYNWDDIKDNLPPQMKISPLALVPHKSRAFRAILDLSFRLRLESGATVPSVNETSQKTAPKAACEQLGHVLNRIIHAMAEAEDDAKVFMAKFDVKDGFWRLNCQQGEEWNFAYVLPQEEGKPVKIVVPTSLQMGWIESPPFFCAASETARDVAEDYVETPIGSRPAHKFEAYTKGDAAYQQLPAKSDGPLRYLIEVYVDDFIPLAIARSKEQLDHVARGMMEAIHDVFPPNEKDEEDPIALKKLKKGDGTWMLEKDILGFMFNGDEKTLWLEEEKRLALLAILKGWLRTAERSTKGIPFEEFQSILSKIRHAFIAIPAGKGLLSPCNGVLRLEPQFVYLQRHQQLKSTIQSIRTLLRESATNPTKCKQLVRGHPHYVGVKDSSGHGVGGAVVGETGACKPTVFRVEWPQVIRDRLVSWTNPKGSITNSDLEMAGLLLLWLVMEEVCPDLAYKHAALFSDNQPTVCWVERMASKHSIIAGRLLQILALRLHQTKASPITPQHIKGSHNAMTDIPSRSFGSEPKWHFKTDDELLTFFNTQLLERIPAELKDSYEGDFRAADAAFFAGRLEATTKKRQTYWRHWVQYCLPVGVDPYLSHVTTSFQSKARMLTGFAARVRAGFYGRGREVKADTTSAAITAIGQAVSLEHGVDPTKEEASTKRLFPLQVMLDGWRKDEPPTTKKLPVEVDVPEYLAEEGRQAHASPLTAAIGDLILIAFYYLLRVGEYAVKSGRKKKEKQTQQFKVRDVTFFKRNNRGQLRQVPRHAQASELLSADSATLKLDNQKNGWKGVCVHHEANGDAYLCPVRALARRVVHIRQNTTDDSTFLSAYFINGVRYDINNKQVSEALKRAAAALDYPGCKGIPIDRVDTHSLRSGGANALSLAGYTDRQIQKMGRWRSATFLEYIKESLDSFSMGMSKSMRQQFKFVNVEGGVYHDITSVVVDSPYTVNPSTGQTTEEQ